MIRYSFVNVVLVLVIMALLSACGAIQNGAGSMPTNYPVPPPGQIYAMSPGSTLNMIKLGLDGDVSTTVWKFTTEASNMFKANEYYVFSRNYAPGIEHFYVFDVKNSQFFRSASDLCGNKVCTETAQSFREQMAKVGAAKVDPKTISTAVKAAIASAFSILTRNKDAGIAVFYMLNGEAIRMDMQTAPKGSGT